MEIIKYVLEIAVIPLVVGAIASVIATLLINRRINPEELIKRDILKLINIARESCYEDKHHIKFVEKDFLRRVPVWQEYKNQLYKIIVRVSENNDAITLDPRLFGIDGDFYSLSEKEKEAYIQFCNVFINNFNRRFSMDKVYPNGVINKTKKEKISDTLGKINPKNEDSQEGENES